MGEEACGEALDRGLLDALSRLAEELLVYGLRSLVIIGSYARGNWIRESDVDVVIVAEGFRGLPFYERECLVLKRWSHEKPLEAWCYTPEEAEKGIFGKPKIDLVDAIEYGVVIYDDDFWANPREGYGRKPFRRRRVGAVYESIVLEG